MNVADEETGEVEEAEIRATFGRVPENLLEQIRVCPSPPERSHLGLLVAIALAEAPLPVSPDRVYPLAPDIAKPGSYVDDVRFKGRRAI